MSSGSEISNSVTHSNQNLRQWSIPWPIHGDANPSRYPIFFMPTVSLPARTESRS